MSYKSKDLSVLAYANGFTLWHYVTTDADIASANYFDPAADMLRVGDMIMANVDVEGTPAAGFYLIDANSGGSVGVASLTASGGGE